MKHIKKTLAALVILATGYFFVREYQRNIALFSDYQLRLLWPWLAAACVAHILVTLLATGAWKTGMNSTADRRKLTFLESFVIFNSSGLTKYSPGKVWSYAIQMEWLASRGFSRSSTLYVNLICEICSLGTQTLVGLCCLLPVVDAERRLLCGAAFALLAVGYCFFLATHFIWFRLLTAAVNRLFARKITPTRLPVGLLLRMQIAYGSVAILFGLTAALTGFGLNLASGVRDTLSLSAGLLLSNVVGFLVLISPGGLGVREGTMYFLLSDLSSKQLALALPLATRLLGMACDLLLGLLALVLLRCGALTDAKGEASIASMPDDGTLR